MNPRQFILDMGGFARGSGSVSPEVSSEQKNIFENILNAIFNLIPNNPLESILSDEMLGVVIFTIIIGVAITQLNQETARPLVRFAEAV